MFVINDDMSIYVTRGDVLFFTVSALDENGASYKFKADDVVRFTVCEKKACENVVIQKDFVVTEETEEVNILLTEEETKVGKVISKPRDYWYEVELNPFTNPQTIIGYDEEGPRVFRLFPEGDDIIEEEIPEEEIATVDTELSLASTRPVQNQAITRGLLKLSEDIDLKLKGMHDDVNNTMQNTEDRMTDVERRMSEVEVFSNTEVVIEHVKDKSNPHNVTAEQVGARPNTWMPTASDVGARPNTWTPTASEVGARPSNWMPTAGDVGAVPTSRTINGKALSANIILSAADVGAIPASEIGNIGGNKPSGSYKGNGASSRVIATGGTGTIIIFGDYMEAEQPVFAVMNDKYVAVWEMITDAEGDQMSTPWVDESGESSFANGTLTIGDDLDTRLNVSGEGYYYFVV